MITIEEAGKYRAISRTIDNIKQESIILQNQLFDSLGKLVKVRKDLEHTDLGDVQKKDLLEFLDKFIEDIGVTLESRYREFVRKYYGPGTGKE